MSTTKIIPILVAITMITACDQAPTLGRTTQADINFGNTAWITTLAPGNNDKLWVSAMTKFAFIGDPAGSTITGFDSTSLPVGNGFYVRNHGTVPFTIAHEHPNALPADRIKLPNMTDVVLGPYEALLIDQYDVEDCFIAMAPPGTN